MQIINLLDYTSTDSSEWVQYIPYTMVWELGWELTGAEEKLFIETPIFKNINQPGVNERGFLHHSDDDTTTTQQDEFRLYDAIWIM